MFNLQTMITIMYETVRNYHFLSPFSPLLQLTQSAVYLAPDLVCLGASTSMAVSLAPGLLKLLSSLCTVGLVSTEIFLGIGTLVLIGVPGLLGIVFIGVSIIGI